MSSTESVPSAPIEQETMPFAAPRLGIVQRLVFLVAGVGLVILLVIAWRLNPNPAGMGTHRQLGLPPCSLVQWAGIRCPSCGMTTSWSYVVRGNLWRACGVNSGGTLLALTSVVLGPWLIGSSLLGRYLWRPPPMEWIAAASVVIGLVTLVDWGIRLSR